MKKKLTFEFLDGKKEVPNIYDDFKILNIQ